MREIKFRAWDTLRKRMSSSPKWVEFGVKIDGTLYAKNFKPSYIGKGEQELIVMQYTGVKDKKGVEIYEGDILEAFDILGEREIYPVIFIDGAFMGKRLDDEEFPYFYLFANTSLSRTYKVIGNIYENPELLKV